jgi:hypothetical protein
VQQRAQPQQFTSAVAGFSINMRAEIHPRLYAPIFFQVFKERTPFVAAWRDDITIATTIPQLFLAALKFAALVSPPV